jgi:hypothetical protein
VTIHDQLAEVFEQRRSLGLSVPSFDPHSVSEAIASVWVQSLSADTERDALVRKLTVEQHS